MHSRTALIATLGSILFAAACGPDKPADAPATTQTPPVSTPASSASAAASSGAATPAADPAAKARLDAVKATPVATQVAGAKADDMSARALFDTAAWFAAGHTADGPYYKATLAERGKAHFDITLKAGRCYVIVGFAKLGTIVDMDLHLMKPTGELVAEDDDDDTSPTIGKPPICPTVDTAYIVEMAADHGAGEATAQLYSKAK